MLQSLARPPTCTACALEPWVVLGEPAGEWMGSLRALTLFSPSKGESSPWFPFNSTPISSTHFPNGTPSYGSKQNCPSCSDKQRQRSRPQD